MGCDVDGDAIDWVEAKVDATDIVEATLDAKSVDPILSREPSILDTVEELVDATVEEVEVVVDLEEVDSNLVDYRNRDLFGFSWRGQSSLAIVSKLAALKETIDAWALDCSQLNGRHSGSWS